MSSASECNKVIYIRTCRICLDTQCPAYIVLTEENGWLVIFEYCFGVSLKPEDQPRLVCPTCAVKLKKFYAFKTKCHLSEELWKYLTFVKCRVERIALEAVKDFHSTSVKNDTNDSIEDLDAAFSYNNNNTIKSEIIYESESESSDGVTSTVIVNYEPRDNKIFKCENADIISTSERNEDLFSNQIAKSKDIFSCTRCLKNYTTRKWYLKHLELCKVDNQSINSICQSRTFDSYVYNYNIKIENQANLNFLCGICQFSSNKIEDVNEHLEEHWNNHNLQCMTCEFIAKDQAGLAAHRYTHYQTKPSSYLCHICQKKTKSQLNLQFHYRKDHLNKPGGLCSQPKCDKEYNCWRLWKKHEKLHFHPGYICDICGQKYKYKHHIATHLINHTNPSTHICDVCGKTFRRMRNLKVHIQNVHVVAEPVRCPHCDRVFKNQFHLRVHQKRLAMEKTLKCKFCPMEYSMLSQLNSHLKSHSDERPHCCHVCGLRYKAKSQLVIHMRNHTGDRPYKCPLCVKAFTSGTQLKAHTRSHTGVLPFKCHNCKKSFRCKKRMLAHRAVRHKPLE